MKSCDKCGQSKDWEGDDIRCPFENGTEFGHNWRCGIIRKIRVICDKAVDRSDSRLHHGSSCDQNYVTIDTGFADGELGICLWVSWYKDRGSTDSMWVMDSEGPSYKPTFEQLERIVNYYGS